MPTHDGIYLRKRTAEDVRIATEEKVVGLRAAVDYMRLVAHNAHGQPHEARTCKHPVCVEARRALAVY
jgi:hypothetical protein